MLNGESIYVSIFFSERASGANVLEAGLYIPAPH